jgi:exodeoxyribonuclease VII large subunit
MNIPQFSVSEFSRTIKNVVEDAFGYVKITGEITGLKRATSGHVYFNLKDENAVLSAVCFRGAASMIKFEMGDGLQICASGRITTFEGRSNYQIIVDKVEIAGVGAILAMIEKRRVKLMEEGLFDEIHKKPLPFFPKIIGVITSPTGAVIEDIKHRISERCPLHLMLYPTSVQGDKAAGEIIAAIKYFNSLKKNRPEVLIIARGGGSFEDLLPFSDEALIREVFKSEIPIISAVGHETDTTLIDYVSDVRAPTPTAAAEFATPVISDLKAQINFLTQRLNFLPQNFLQEKFTHLERIKRYIIEPATILDKMCERFALFGNKLDLLFEKNFSQKSNQLQNLQLSKNLLLQKINNEKRSLEFIDKSLNQLVKTRVKDNKISLENLAKILQSNHYREILKRGFALIKNEKGDLISSIQEVKLKKEIQIEMSDGEAFILFNEIVNRS